MIPFIPIVSALLAVISEEIRSKGKPEPRSPDELILLIQDKWDEAQHGALPAIEELSDLIHELWSESGRRPEYVPWGELVPDPFAKVRQEQDTALATQHAREEIALQWPTDQLAGKVTTSIGSSISDPRISFSDTRRGEHGWYIPDDGTDPVLQQLQKGDLIGDVNDMSVLQGLESRPYWQVTGFEDRAIMVKAVGDNPLTTGILAGGGQISETDLDVLSGDFEDRNVSWRVKAIANGERDIDIAKYLLLGTCATNFGPNGAQGGWYHPANARSSRGGKLGLSPEETIEEDAAWLHRYGFPVPVAALEHPPRISVKAWTDWINGPATSGAEILVPSLAGHLAWLRSRNVDEIGIARVARRISREALERYLERKLQLFLRDRDEYHRRHPYSQDNLKDIVMGGVYELEEQARTLAAQRAYDIKGEDSSQDWSVQKHLYHPERRVSVRNAMLAVDRAAIGTVWPSFAHWRDVLMRWLRRKKSDWLAYEQAIVFANEARDIGLLEAAGHLPDETNRAWAMSGLSKHDHKSALAFLAHERHPKVISAIISDPEVKDRSDLKAVREASRRRVHEFHDYVLPQAIQLPPKVPADERTYDQSVEEHSWQELLGNVKNDAYWLQWWGEHEEGAADEKVVTVLAAVTPIIEERWPRR